MHSKTSRWSVLLLVLLVNAGWLFVQDPAKQPEPSPLNQIGWLTGGHLGIGN